MASGILFFCEGHKGEPEILKKVVYEYFGDVSSNCFFYSYGTLVYELWREIKDDEDLESSALLLEHIKANNRPIKKIINGIISPAEIPTREEISQIYLIFDYDGHDNRSHDPRLGDNGLVLEKIIDFFDNETDKGKLFVNYPMLEAMRHIHKDTGDVHDDMEIIDGRHYKERVGNEGKHQNFGLVEKVVLDSVVMAHLKKAYALVNGTLKPELLTDDDVLQLTQSNIFTAQKSDYIVNGRLAILSGIPLFIIHHLGLKALSDYPPSQL